MSGKGFDFNEQAKALVKRLGQSVATPQGAALAVAAVEAALREAYAHGQGVARVAPPAPAQRIAAKQAPARERVPAPQPAAPPECAHEWEESFLDGRAVGSQCLHCGMLERDVQDRCDHYFVQTGTGEVCVACRKPKRRSS